MKIKPLSAIKKVDQIKGRYKIHLSAHRESMQKIDTRFGSTRTRVLQRIEGLVHTSADKDHKPNEILDKVRELWDDLGHEMKRVRVELPNGDLYDFENFIYTGKNFQLKKL